MMIERARPLQYEIDLNYHGFQARSIIIEADSNFEAREPGKRSFLPEYKRPETLV